LERTWNARDEASSCYATITYILIDTLVLHTSPRSLAIIYRNGAKTAASSGGYYQWRPFSLLQVNINAIVNINDRRLFAEILHALLEASC